MGSLAKLKDGGVRNHLKVAGTTRGIEREDRLAALCVKWKTRCKPEELKDAGFSGQELKDSGFSLKELKDAGFSAQELSDTGFTAQELKDAGATSGISNEWNWVEHWATRD
jgi:ribosomal protein L13E